MDMLNNIYDFPSFNEAVRHVLEDHGLAGQLIAADPNQAPIMWHELVGHSDPALVAKLTHNHFGYDPEETKRRFEKLMNDMQDPERLAEIVETIKQAAEQGLI